MLHNTRKCSFRFHWHYEFSLFICIFPFIRFVSFRLYHNESECMSMIEECEDSTHRNEEKKNFLMPNAISKPIFHISQSQMQSCVFHSTLLFLCNPLSILCWLWVHKFFHFLCSNVRLHKCREELCEENFEWFLSFYFINGWCFSWLDQATVRISWDFSSISMVS